MVFSIKTPSLRLELVEVFADYSALFRALKFCFRSRQWRQVDQLVVQADDEQHFKDRLLGGLLCLLQRQLDFQVPLDAKLLQNKFGRGGYMQKFEFHLDISNILSFLKQASFQTTASVLVRECHRQLRMHERNVMLQFTNLAVSCSFMSHCLKKLTSSYMNQLSTFFFFSAKRRDELKEKLKLKRIEYQQWRNRCCKPLAQMRNEQRAQAERAPPKLLRARKIGEKKKIFYCAFPHGDEEIIYQRYLLCLFLFEQQRKKKMFRKSVDDFFSSVRFGYPRRANLGYKKLDFQVLPPKWGPIQHEMDRQDPTSTDPVSDISVNQTENVLTVDEGTVASVNNGVVSNYNSRIDEGRESSIVREMCSRYAYFSSFIWDSSSQPGTIIKTFNLPYDFKDDPFKSSPNVVMLTKWYYWSFDLDFRISVNATKFQVGQLLISWAYDFSKNDWRYATIQSQSQAPHAILCAPVNNVVELIIPFKFKYPYWCTDEISQEQRLVVVRVAVLNALACSDAAAPRANVVMQLRLRNVRVAGLRAFDQSSSVFLAEHQMFSLAVRSVEKLLRNTLADFNRDNPTSPLPHSSVIPYSAHSWCVGNNQVELLNPLRLDVLATTPHLESIDEMSVSFITRHFGFMKTIEWTTSQASTTQLFKLAVTPLNICDLVQSNAADPSKSLLPQYCSTPLSVISSMFAYWRGSLEFRFDFVASMFHTGRLAFCFVPSLSDIATLKFNNAIQSYIQYFDLGGEPSFTYICPYICNNTWMPMRKASIEFATTLADSSIIGVLAGFVVNPLVAVTGVSAAVKINMYIRAGNDFQVAVPVYPVLSPENLGQNYIPVSSQIRCKKGYFPVYAGSWRNWYGFSKVILRYGETTDHIAQFEPLVKDAVFYAKDSVYYVDKKTNTQVACNYFCRANTGDGYFYLTCFPSYTSAKMYLDTTNPIYLLDFSRVGSNAWNDGQVLIPVEAPQLRHEAGDERLDNHLAGDFNIVNTLTSAISFNEDFSDLKTLCRRYQIYADFSVKVSKNTPFGGIFFNVPLYPAGYRIAYDELSVGNLSQEFINRARASPMTLLASGFRFFRGGLRAKVLIRSADGTDLLISLTHIPDRDITDKPGVVVPSDTQHFASHGYAYYAQSTRVNECFELEIPFYLNCDYGLLLDSDSVDSRDKRHCYLGNLAFSLMSRLSKDIDLGIQVFLAFADDMRFSSFQGFPKVCSTFQIPVSGSPAAESNQLSQASSFEELSIQHEMLGLETKLSNCVKKLGNELKHELTSSYPSARDVIKSDVIDAVKQGSIEACNQTKELIDYVKNSLGEAFSMSKNLIMNVISNVMHILVNPCIKSVLIAIVSIIGSCCEGFNWCFESLHSFYRNLMEFLCSTFTRTVDFVRMCKFCWGFGCSRCSSLSLQAREQAQHEAWYDSCETLGSLSQSYATLISAFLGYKTHHRQINVPNFLSHLALNFSKYSAGIAGLTDFIKVNLQMFYECVDWLLVKSTGSGIDRYVYSYPDELAAFCKNAHAILSPLNRQRVLSEPYLQRSVFRLAAIAHRINLYESLNSSRSKINVYIRDLCTKLTQLQEILIQDCLCPMVRYEPFVLHVTGQPGIGKSEIKDVVSYELLEGIGYRTYSEPIYTRTPGTTYWNGIRNQPVVYYDDFLFMRDGTMQNDHISELMTLKSSATFNPNIAELENKKIRYNPLIVYLSSNHAFWPDAVSIRDIGALHRRRDSLWYARLREGYSMDRVKQQAATRGTRTFDHLEFGKFPDVTDVMCFPTRWFTYEQFKTVIVKEFREYHTQELQAYESRLRQLNKLQPPSSGLEYDEHIEEEVLAFLSKQNDISLHSKLDDWRKSIVDSCDSTLATVRGLVPVVQHQGKPGEMTPLLDSDEEDDFRSVVCDPPIPKFLWESFHKPECDDEFKCEHYHHLSLHHRYIEFSTPEEEDQSPFYKYCYIEGAPSWLREELPFACSYGSKCWLKSEVSAVFRNCYIQAQYAPQIRKLVEVNKYDIVPWARSIFSELIEIPDFNTSEEKKKNFLSRLKNHKFSNILSVIGKVLKWFGIISVGLLAIFGGFKAIQSFGASESDSSPTATTPDPWHMVSPQYMPSGDVRVGRKALPKNWAKQAKIRAAVLKNKFAQPQANYSDPNTTLLKIIERNAFESFILVNGKIVCSQKGLGICGRNALTTKHFIEEFKYQVDEAVKSRATVKFLFKVRNLQHQFHYEQCKFCLVDDSSLALVTFPVTLNAFRDIRHHIIRTDDLEYLGTEGKFFELVDGASHITQVVFSAEECISIGGAGHISDQELPMCYSYPISGLGKCGSVLIACTPIPRIIGIHVAGLKHRSFGFSQAIFREMFESLSGPQVCDPNIQNESDCDPKIELPFGVLPVCVISPELCPSHPRKSEIIPSLAFDQIYPHQTEPAVLSKFDKRVLVDPDTDPMVKAIKTHGNVPLPFDADLLNECVQDLSEFLISTSPPHNLIVEDLLSDQVIFGGIPNGDCFNKLNLQSSEGYPLSLLRQHCDRSVNLYKDKKLVRGLPCKGKSWLFDYEVDEYGYQLREIHPELVELMEHNDTLRKQGICPATIFVDTLKDSRVAPEKVKLGKTRMFSISPIEFTWAIKKYFGVFQAAYQQNRIKNGTAIGINVRGPEWTQLVRSLLKRGPNFIVGDYKAFGDTLERQVMFGAFQCIINWYSKHTNSCEVNQRYRQVLVEELFNCYHLCSNVLYQMCCGIPSGFALTVEINDLVNQLYMRYCWKKITNLPMSMFYRHVKCITYGDDIIMSVSDEMIGSFNFRTIQRCLDCYNISFQPASKDDSVYEKLSLWEVTFLKCHFVRHPVRQNQFLAQLPLESCLDMLNWQYRGNDSRSIIFENARAALNNLYGCGPVVYNEWREKILMWFAEQGRRGILFNDDCFIHLKTWKDVDLEVFGDCV